MHIFTKMPKYTTESYDIVSNEALDESIRKIFPTTVLPNCYSTYWKSFKGIVHKMTIPITETTLYEWCVKEKVLAFSYALVCKNYPVKGKPNETISQMEFYFQIWNNVGCMSKLIQSLYHEVAEIDAPEPEILAGMKAHVPKRLCLSITVAGTCSLCKRSLYNRECLNFECAALKLPHFSRFVSNKGGEIVLSVNEIFKATNGAFAKTKERRNCKKCSSCRICQRLSTLCMRHVICLHDRKKKLKRLLESSDD